MSSRCALFVGLALMALSGCNSSETSLLKGGGKASTTDRDQSIILPAPDLNKLFDATSALYSQAAVVKTTVSLFQSALDPQGKPIASMQAPAKDLTYVVGKPNRLAIRSVNPTGPQIFCDGKELLVYVPFMEKRYVREEAPPDAAGLLTNAELLAIGGPVFFFPIHFAMADFDREALRGFTDRRYVGAESIDGVPAYHIRLVSEDPQGMAAGNAFHLWIAAEDQPRILRTRFDTGTQSIEVEKGTRRDMPTAVIADYSDWQFDPKTDESTWQASLPLTAVEVTAFGLTASSLYGQPAPAFDTTTVSGEPASLAQHQGKDVVLIDFWAIGCIPCRVEMPAVDAIASEFADQGVVAYAVNSEDSVSKIREFMEGGELAVKVIADTEHSIAKSYGVTGPLVAIIDREGNLAGLHAGFETSLEGSLRRELQALLAGRSLKTPPVVEAKAP